MHFLCVFCVFFCVFFSKARGVRTAAGSGKSGEGGAVQAAAQREDRCGGETGSDDEVRVHVGHPTSRGVGAVGAVAVGSVGFLLLVLVLVLVFVLVLVLVLWVWLVLVLVLVLVLILVILLMMA